MRFLRFPRLLLLLPVLAGAFAASAGKIVSAPCYPYAKINVDGVPDEAVWKRASTVSGFYVRKNEGGVGYDSDLDADVRIFRTDAKLYLAVTVRTPDGVFATPEKSDFVEVFFGNFEPKQWIIQTMIYANGTRYNELLSENEWKSAVKVSGKEWSFEAEYPLDKMILDGDSVRFNLCFTRVRKTGPIRMDTWVPMPSWFHTMSRYGTLKMEPPAPETVTHGPWIFNPAPDSMDVAWESAGPAGAQVQLRKAGEKEFRTLPVDVAGGVIRRDKSLHRYRFSGLEPETKYEFRIRTLFPGDPDGITLPESGCYSFRTLSADPKKSIRFALTSDIHMHIPELKALSSSPEVQAADFFVLLGDIQTASWARDSYYYLLDAILKCTDTPLVYTRGNHEYVGRGTGLYFDMLGPDPTRGYFAFRHGPALFIVLDTGENGDIDDVFLEYIAQEHRWLQALSRSKAYREAAVRIVLTHIPCARVRQNDGVIVGEQYIPGILGDLLTETAPERRIDLMLAGHRHHYFKVPADSDFIPHPKDPKGTPVRKTVFPVAANHFCGLLDVTVSADAITVTAKDASGKLLEKTTFPVKR